MLALLAPCGISGHMPPVPVGCHLILPSLSEPITTRRFVLL